MPNSEEHKEKFEHNKKFLNLIENEKEYNDWQVIVIFYCVVHHLEKLIYECYQEMLKGKKLTPGFIADSGDHKGREELLQKTKEFENSSQAWNDYSAIKAESIKQRYEYFFANDKKVASIKRRAARIEALTKLTLK